MKFWAPEFLVGRDYGIVSTCIGHQGRVLRFPGSFNRRAPVRWGATGIVQVADDGEKPKSIWRERPRLRLPAYIVYKEFIYCSYRQLSSCVMFDQMKSHGRRHLLASNEAGACRERTNETRTAY